MHDFFEILGVGPGARAEEIQRACRKRPRRAHPDVEARNVRPEVSVVAGHADVAIDFPDVPSIVDRMRAAFFRTPA